MIKLSTDYYIIEDLVDYYTEITFPSGILHRALNKNNFMPINSINFPLVIKIETDYDNDYAHKAIKITDTNTILKLINVKKVELECTYSTLIDLENIFISE